MSDSPDLTDKQRAFIEQYFICGFNATEAAKRAGYQGNQDVLSSVGWENLRKPEIKAEIERRMAEFHMSANEVLARLADHAAASLDDFLSSSGRGIKLDLVKAKKAGKLHLVKSYNKGKQGLKIELVDQQAALVALARHHNLLTDKMDITSGGEPLKVNDAEYNRAISTLFDTFRDFISGESADPEGPVGSTK